MNDISCSKASIVRRAALTLLARRDYAKAELKRKLLRHNHPLKEIESVLTDLIQKGLLNDTRFAENFIHSRRTKGYGPLRILMELRKYGISEEVIAEQLKITDNAWFVEIRHVWHKRFKNKSPSNIKDHVKQLRFLQYRGFTREQIASVMRLIEE